MSTANSALCMENYCAFSKNHKCILWTDYEITREELSECHTLCHGNWIEIERKYKYIQELKKILSDHEIPYPECSSLRVLISIKSTMIIDGGHHGIRL